MNTNTDTSRPRCLRDDRPVRSCTAAAGSVVGCRIKSIVQQAAFWTAIAFPTAYVVGGVDPVAAALPIGWLPLALATHLLLLWVGHGARHPE